jgi:hypothetical protein
MATPPTISVVSGSIGVLTKPSIRPLSYALWLAVHSWLGRDGSWPVVGIRHACWICPFGYGLVAVGSPFLPSLKPSGPRPHQHAQPVVV